MHGGRKDLAFRSWLSIHLLVTGSLCDLRPQASSGPGGDVKMRLDAQENGCSPGKIKGEQELGGESLQLRRGRGTVKGEGKADRGKEPQTAGKLRGSQPGGRGIASKDQYQGVGRMASGSFLLSLMCGWESLGATTVLRDGAAKCCQTAVPQQWGLLERSSERQLQGRYMPLFSLSMPRLNVAQLHLPHMFPQIAPSLRTSVFSSVK